MVITRTGKPGKIEEHFPVRGKSVNLTQSTGKIRKFEKKKYVGIVWEICQPEKLKSITVW